MTTTRLPIAALTAAALLATACGGDPEFSARKDATKTKVERELARDRGGKAKCVARGEDRMLCDVTEGLTTSLLEILLDPDSGEFLTRER